jgi:hypothetical protein
MNTRCFRRGRGLCVEAPAKLVGRADRDAVAIDCRDAVGGRKLLRRRLQSPNPSVGTKRPVTFGCQQHIERANLCCDQHGPSAVSLTVFGVKATCCHLAALVVARSCVFH